MNRKLAIKGHSTRGNKVIELLEMMGGNNIHNLSGDINSYAYYVIEECGTEIRAGEYIFGNEDMCFFTLEEFLKKYPHKVGDKVVDGCGNTLTIKSMSWSTDCETMVYDFEDSVIVLAAEDIRFAYDGNAKPTKMKTVLAELIEHINTTSKEELEKEFLELEEWCEVGPTVSEYMEFVSKINKKPKYPDDYEECVRIAKNIHGYDIHIDAPAYRELMESFVKLLICRDAYWKIAGEEMGLDGPWEPDYTDLNNITYYGLYDKLKYSIINPSRFVFPTVEMRDAFYENFKDLIESCKELL